MGAEQLTQAQRAAVENRGGPLLVSAAAGSGKTKVLVDRLMGYLLDPVKPANVDEFLIITYTKAAASELRGKIAAKLSETLAQHPNNRHLRHQLQRLYLAKISTVHAFCAELLREYAFALELPGDARVADENETAELRQLAMDGALEEAYRSIDKDPALQTFVDTQGFGRDDRAVPRIVEAVYNSAQCHVRPETWLKAYLMESADEDIQDAGQTPWGRYLIDGLHRYLEEQAQVLREVLSRVNRTDDLADKYGPTLEANIDQLEALTQYTTWDQIHNNLIRDFGRLKPVRNPSDPELCDAVKALRSAAYEGLKELQPPFEASSSQLLEDMEQARLSGQGLCHLVLQFSQRYRSEKERRRVLDFGDLEHRTLELLLGRNLTGPTRAAAEIGSRFREVMVDEYQDTNEVQDRIFSALTAKHGNCFMVGDVKQSIYRFRLADPGIFLEKYQSFVSPEHAQPGQGRKILLSENFRSGEEILRAANHVFHHTMCPQVGGLYYGDDESLRAGIPHEPLPQVPVELHCIQLEDATKYDTEAQFVAKRIRGLLTEPAMVRGKTGLRPVTPGDIVILLRSPGTSAQYYLDALKQLNIPASADSGGSILDTGEIAIVRCLLEVLDNPLQDIPLESVLASPLFAFTADHLARIRAGHREGSLFEALEAAGNGGDKDAEAFLLLLKDLRQIARLEPLARLVEEIYARTHMEALFRSMDGGEARGKNLEFFFETAAAFEQGGRKDLPQFLEHLNRLEQRGLRYEKGGANDAVSILSIHKSKGLEYPVVFLSNLSGRFNRDDLKSNVLVDPVLGIGCSILDRENRCRYPSLAKIAIGSRIKQENTSEELRVLYVAMTRARDMLIMTYADKYIRTHLQDLVRRVSPKNVFTLSQEAGCPGHWILQAALLRTEAGELFQQVGRPEETWSDGAPWRICYHVRNQAASQGSAPAEAASPTPLPDLEELVQAASFQYCHMAAAQAPSKVTATQLKGRELDQETADGAFQPLARVRSPWRQPDFAAPATLQGREIGTATHLAMQFIRYEVCSGSEAVEAELARMKHEEFLTQRQYEAVNRQWIVDFFRTPFGEALRSHPNILREFKFSILVPGDLLDADLAQEQVMLQGVVDCCLLDEDGLTVLDFKTDRVSPGREQEAAARYKAQVLAYGEALCRIWSRPVKKRLLYFFQTGVFVEI